MTSIAEEVEIYARLACDSAASSTALKEFLKGKTVWDLDRVHFQLYLQNARYYLGQARKLARQDPTNAAVIESIRSARNAVERARRIAKQYPVTPS